MEKLIFWLEEKRIKFFQKKYCKVFTESQQKFLKLLDKISFNLSDGHLLQFNFLRLIIALKSYCCTSCDETIYGNQQSGCFTHEFCIKINVQLFLLPFLRNSKTHESETELKCQKTAECECKWYIFGAFFVLKVGK